MFESQGSKPVSAKELAKDILENADLALRNPESHMALVNLRKDVQILNPPGIGNDKASEGNPKLKLADEVNDELKKLAGKNLPGIGVTNSVPWEGGPPVPEPAEIFAEIAIKEKNHHRTFERDLYISANGFEEITDYVLPDNQPDRDVPNRAGWKHHLKLRSNRPTESQ